MATSPPRRDRQATVHDFGGEVPNYGVHEYQLGDLLEDRGNTSSPRLRLRECPLCASDPTKPRHHFEAGESRSDHFERRH